MKLFMEKDYIKTYTRVFAIALPLQIVGFCSIWLGFALLWFQVFVFAVTLIASLVVGIWLPLKQGETLLQKILIILLSPTNYSCFYCAHLGEIVIELKLALFEGPYFLPW